MKVTAINYPEFHERMAQMREMELGLDGAICAGGGDVRVHLPYMAACNQTLYNRITGLAKQNKNELIARNIPLAGVQLIVDYCYSGEMVITVENFEHIVEAALGLEFLNVTNDCVQFALETNANANIWCQFLRAAFKHPRSVQPKEFVPNLILDNITRIPKEAVTKGLDAAYIREILDSGEVVDTNKCYTINLFLEILLAEKADIEHFKDTIGLMRDIVVAGDTLTIPKETNERSILALTKLALEINFTSLVKACAEAMISWPSTAYVTSQVLQWMKQYARSESVTFLDQVCFYAFTSLPLDICEDDLCLILDSNCLEKMAEYDIFKTTHRWIQYNTTNIESKCRVISLIRYGLMTKEEMFEVLQDYPIQGCGDIFVDAIRYHLKIHEQPLALGTMNKARRGHVAIYIMGGEDEGNNFNTNVYLSTAVSENRGITLLPFTKLCVAPFALQHNRCAELNGFVFISGGITESGTTVAVLWRFDPRSKTWLELEKMNHERARHTLTTVDTNLLAIGGMEGSHTIDSVEKYDVGTNTWMELEPFPETIYQHAATYSDGILYVSGGSGTKALRCLSGDVWDTKSSMLHVRDNHNMTSVSGMLFVAGGSVVAKKRWINVSSAECYDVVQDQWTELVHPSLAFSLSCSGRIGKWVYIFGGFNQKRQQKLEEIQRYDSESNTWDMCETKLPFKVRQLLLACISGE